MKRSILLISFLLVFFSMSATDLVHAYWGDFFDVVRLVFVFKTNVHYSTLMDSDNRAIHVHVNNANLSASILPIDFSETPLINEVTYQQSGRDLRFTITTGIVFYAESFYLAEENFKVVFDIYRQREPATLEQAMNYLHFYVTVGYYDRAAALRLRINNNDFINPISFNTEPVFSLPPPPPPPPVRPEPIIELPPPPPPPLVDFDDNIVFHHENLLFYLKPDATYLSANHQNWINEAFRIYDMFLTIHTNLDHVERTLEIYDAQGVVNMTFIETMSISFNILSDASIRLNEIRLLLNNLWERRLPSREPPIQYTNEMIQHILSILNSYQNRVIHLQREYNRRIHL